MKCILCGDSDWGVVFEYTEPDKYEEWVGLKDIKRQWLKCPCGMIQQSQNYPLEFLEKIYEDGYRHPKFRGETINKAFHRINAIPNNENSRRIKWMLKSMDNIESVLDVGAGIDIKIREKIAFFLETKCARVSVSDDPINYLPVLFGVKADVSDLKEVFYPSANAYFSD